MHGFIERPDFSCKIADQIAQNALLDFQTFFFINGHKSWDFTRFEPVGALFDDHQSLLLGNGLLECAAV